MAEAAAAKPNQKRPDSLKGRPEALQRPDSKNVLFKKEDKREEALPVKQKGERPDSKPQHDKQSKDKKDKDKAKAKDVKESEATLAGQELNKKDKRKLREREKSLHLDQHPAIIKLGYDYRTGRIRGGNARCIAMLHAFKDLIRDYKTPQDKILARDMLQKLNPPITYLVACRKMSASMGNAINHLKGLIHRSGEAQDEETAKREIIEGIDRFIDERIIAADEVIVSGGMSRITDGDVIMTYARSHVVEQIFFSASQAGKKFEVIIVDSKPLFEGREMLRRLFQRGIKCTYALLPSVYNVMCEVTKVMIGASTILSNGSILARAGTAVVTMTAKDHRKPVLCCCETYKFVDKVCLNSLTMNEEADPAMLASCPHEPLEASIAQPVCQSPPAPAASDAVPHEVLNLLYDLTPIDYVDMVITEVGMIPPTSVPVILREYHCTGLEDAFFGD